jgi:hypothetical protein
LTSINAFMGQMRDGNTRELIANLQSQLIFQLKSGTKPGTKSGTNGIFTAFLQTSRKIFIV